MMKENVDSVKKDYLKPLMEILFFDVPLSILAGSPTVGRESGEAGDDTPLSAKHGEYFDEDV